MTSGRGYVMRVVGEGDEVDFVACCDKRSGEESGGVRPAPLTLLPKKSRAMEMEEAEALPPGTPDGLGCVCVCVAECVVE